MPLPSARRALTAAFLCAIIAASAACSSSDDPADTSADADPDSATADHTAGTDAAAEEESEAPAEARTYIAGEDIVIELTMTATDDGGRRTGFFSGYRPTLEFADGTASTCALTLHDIESFEPGDTHAVTATCKDDVTVEPLAVDVDVIEGGAVRGTGVVVLDAE